LEHLQDRKAWLAPAEQDHNVKNPDSRYAPTDAACPGPEAQVEETGLDKDAADGQLENTGANNDEGTALRPRHDSPDLCTALQLTNADVERAEALEFKGDRPFSTKYGRQPWDQRIDMLMCPSLILCPANHHSKPATPTSRTVPSVSLGGYYTEQMNSSSWTPSTHSQKAW
jgi:hypothetical protein